MKPMNSEIRDAAARHLASSVRAPDYWRINLAQEWEIRFWSKELGIDEATLRATVAKVGSSAGDVRAHLLQSQ